MNGCFPCILFVIAILEKPPFSSNKILLMETRSRRKSPATTSKSKEGVRESWNYEFHDRIDPTLEFFYRPHNISLLILVIATLIYTALFRMNDHDPIFNMKVGISCAVGVLLLVGMLSFKDGPFIRPRMYFAPEKKSF